MTVIFSTVFQEETDRIFGKVFLQEFYDARRLPSLQSAPQVLYSNREPPSEIRHISGLSSDENVGYVTFGGSSFSLSLSLTCVDSCAMLTPTACCSPLSATLCPPSNGSKDHLADSALPRLPALPHQVLKGLHAQPDASAGCRVPQGAEPSKARGGREGEEDGEREELCP